MTCLICGSKQKVFSKVKHFTIYKCTNCGFGTTNGASVQNSDYHRDQIYIEEENLFKNIFQKRANKIAKVISGGKILEIGCSTGLLLSLLAEKGFEVFGVEISEKAATAAKEKGLKVYQQKFEKIEFSENFDGIIFNHTLEHIEEPIKALKKASSLLKPKGFLYIDLPNFDSLTAKLFKKRWPLLLPEEHLWHFSLKSLEIIFKQLDFKIVFTEKASGIWDYQKPIRGNLNSLIKLKKRFFREFLTAGLSLLVTKLGKGSDLMVIARKK